MLKLESISRSYGNTKAVDKLSLNITRGEVLGLVGESGCGKSTLARIITGLEKPDSGNISYDGKKRIQMVFQDPYSSINPGRKIGWLLDEAIRLSDRSIDKATRRENVKSILFECGLDDSFINRYPSSLSGGQRQRAAIALSLVCEPEFIVADEPVSALDVSVQAQILNLFSALREKHQFTCLFISHDLSVVSYLADRIAVMYLGQIVETGDADDVINNSRHPYTRALFDAAETIETTLKGEAEGEEKSSAGCPFAPRCPYADDICRKERPETQSEGNHFYACHHPLERNVQ